MKNKPYSQVAFLLFGLSVVIVSLVVAYYFVIALPKRKDNERLAQTNTAYFGCLKEADDEADKLVAEYCKQSNDRYKDCIKNLDVSFCATTSSVTYSPNCKIYPVPLEFTNKQYSEAQENCHSKYPEVTKRKERYFDVLQGKVITERLVRE